MSVNIYEFKCYQYEIEPQEFLGCKVITHNDVFFDKLHIVPKKLPSLDVNDGITHELKVFNTYRTTANITPEIVGTGTGIYIQDLNTALEPFQEDDFQLFISEEGSLSYAFKARFTVNGEDLYHVWGYDYDDNITGFRAMSWLYDVDYSQPVNELYEYKTDIIEAYSGDEQRIALLEEPDATLYNNYVLDGNDWIEARNKVTSWHHKRFVVPNRNTHFILRDVKQGDTTLDVPGRFFAANGLVVLKTNTDSAVLQIAEVFDSYIVLSDSVPRDLEWCECVHAGIYYLNPDFQFTNLNADVVQFTASFKANEETYSLPIVVDDLEYFEGLPLLNFKHNFAQQATHKMFYENSGAGWGTTIKERKNRVNGFDYTYIFDLEGMDIHRFKALAHEVKGREGSFWLVDHTKAFTVVGGSGAKIEIKDSLARNVLPGAFSVLRIDTHEGVFYRRVKGVSYSDGKEIVELDYQLTDEAHSSIVDIKLMYIARFLNDTFDYGYYHDQYARISKSIRVVQSLQPVQ